MLRINFMFPVKPNNLAKQNINLSVLPNSVLIKALGLHVVTRLEMLGLQKKKTQTGPPPQTAGVLQDPSMLGLRDNTSHVQL